VNSETVKIAVGATNGSHKRLVIANVGQIEHRAKLDTDSDTAREKFIKKLSRKSGIDLAELAHLDGELTAKADEADEQAEHAAAEVAEAATKADAASADPATEAADFLKAVKAERASRLLFWRGGFHSWRHGRYADLQSAEVRAQVARNLNRKFHHVTSAATSNVLDQVRCQSLLTGDAEPPAWIGKAPNGWSAGDMLAAGNGLIHLPTFASGGRNYIIRPTPEFFSLSALDYEFRADAPEPRLWLEFLATLWPDDAASIAALQQWFGYILSGDTSQQKILMLVGPRRSGKGTIVRVLRGTVGAANTAGPTLASFAQHFGLWPLLGKSLAVVNDARLSGRTDQAQVVERLLSISGEDAQTVDRKNLEAVTCKLPTRLMIVSNELPRLADSAGALASRLILLRLTRSFLGTEDTDLTAKLLGELPGVLLWAIEGWKRLREQGRFVQPESSATLIDEMEDLASPVGAFVRECCVVDASLSIPRKLLYERYRDWATRAGKEHVEDEPGFGRALRAAVPTLRDSHPRVDGVKVRHYVGVDTK
jgi:putative DNA primase/helicase